MRDRLIELLENATGTQYYGDEIIKTEIDIDEDDIKRIADYLLANGVIAFDEAVPAEPINAGEGEGKQ